MKPADETSRALLTARAYLYAYTSRAFEREPNEAFLDAIASDEAATFCALLGEDGEGRRLQEEIAASVVDASLDSVQQGYMHALVGPDKLAASPWESVYLGHDHLVFQKPTLEVRESFRSEGYIGKSYPHEPDDHVGTELAFMATLAQKALDCYARGDTVECERLLNVQRSFLEKHLLKWIGAYAQDFQRAQAENPLYATFAQLAALLCREDLGMIDELLG